MFDMNAIAEKIRNARIKKNMTQSNLADELGVSFQAVSNWERGNSLPDISKYEDLCRILDMKLDYLLGFGAETDTVNKLLVRRKEEEITPVTMKEIVPIAPILPPNELKEMVDEGLDCTDTRMEDLIGLIPFLDCQTIDELTKNVVVSDVSELFAVAPFLSKERVSELAVQCLKNNPDHEEITIDTAIALAPFLERNALESLLDGVETDDISMLTGLAPFISKQKLDELTANVIPCDISEVYGLAPFLSREGLESLLERLDVTADITMDSIKGLAPFVSANTLKEMIRKAGGLR